MSISCLFVRWWFKGRLVKICEKCNSHRNIAITSSLESTHLRPMQNLRMEVKFFTSLQRMLIGCLFVSWWYQARLSKISEKCTSHCNKAFVSSLQDAHLGPMQRLKMEVKFFTSLESRLRSCLFVCKWFLCWDIQNSENRLSHRDCVMYHC